MAKLPKGREFPSNQTLTTVRGRKVHYLDDNTGWGLCGAGEPNKQFPFGSAVYLPGNPWIMRNPQHDTLQLEEVVEEKEVSLPFKEPIPKKEKMEKRERRRARGRLVNCYKCLKMLYLQELEEEGLEAGEFLRDFIPTQDKAALEETIANTRAGLRREKAKAAKGEKNQARKYENRLKRQEARLKNRGWNRRQHAMVPLGLFGPAILGQWEEADVNWPDLKARIITNIKRDKKLNAPKRTQYISLLNSGDFIKDLIKDALFMEIWQNYSPWEVGPPDARTQQYVHDPSQGWYGSSEGINMRRADPERIKWSQQRIAGMKKEMRGMVKDNNRSKLLRLSKLSGWVGEYAKDLLMSMPLGGKKRANPPRLTTDAFMDEIRKSPPQQKSKIRVKRRKR